MICERVWQHSLADIGFEDDSGKIVYDASETDVLTPGLWNQSSSALSRKYYSLQKSCFENPTFETLKFIKTVKRSAAELFIDRGLSEPLVELSNVRFWSFNSMTWLMTCREPAQWHFDKGPIMKDTVVCGLMADYNQGLESESDRVDNLRDCRKRSSICKQRK